MGHSEAGHAARAAVIEGVQVRLATRGHVVVTVTGRGVVASDERALSVSA